MAACARAKLFDPREVGVYHIWNRVVRQARLCGVDRVTEVDYGYRRDWITTREQLLAQLFAIDIGFHAELSNHIHLVLRNRPDLVDTWSDAEVIRRWLTITKLTRSFTDELTEPDAARVRMKASDPDYVAKVRLRLSSISCFMGALQEYVARRANAEEDSHGKFWEERFRCRKCTDEAAVVVCGIYVDLNQMRAREAESPETSTHTSIGDRIHARGERDAREAQDIAVDQLPPLRDSWLCPLSIDQDPHSDVRPGQGSATPWRASDKGIVPLTYAQYVELLRWTAANVRSNKRVVIPSSIHRKLEQLQIRPDRWLDLIMSLDRHFRRALGRLVSLLQAATAAGQRWWHGVRLANELFS